MAGTLMVGIARSQQPRHGPLLAWHVSTVTLGYTTTLLIGTLTACYLAARLFGTPRSPQLPGLVRAARQLTATALVCTIFGVTLGGFWAQEHLGRFWGWDPKELGGAAVVVWDGFMLLALARRPLSDHALLLLGLGGNAVVALAWFGPHVLGLGLHAHGWSTSALPLGVFLLAQVALACLGLVPAGALCRRVS